MKILTVVGSFRRNGNTARITRLIEEQMVTLAALHNEPLETETVFLAHEDVRPCRGCRVCFDQGEDRCPHQDDLLAIKAKMAAANGIIVASPVYVNDVSGVVKSWIDRLAHVNHRPEFAGKCAYLVATVGDGPANHALRTLDMAIRGWGYHVVGKSGFRTGALMDQAEIKARHLHQAERIGKRLFHAVHRRRYAQPSFLSLMTFKIQQRYWQQPCIQDSVDFRYWASRGWTEPHREFYIPHEVNHAKVACARAAGALIARIVT